MTGNRLTNEQRAKGGRNSSRVERDKKRAQQAVDFGRVLTEEDLLKILSDIAERSGKPEVQIRALQTMMRYYAGNKQGKPVGLKILAQKIGLDHVGDGSGNDFQDDRDASGA